MSNQDDECPPQACRRGRCEACSEGPTAQATVERDEDCVDNESTNQLPKELDFDVGGEG